MAYDLSKWEKRMHSRSDMSAYLTHLTKEKDDMNEVQVLIKILSERTIIGSTTSSAFIVGDDTACCFQDTPLYGLSQNVYHEVQHREELGGKTRYQACGISFNKWYVFNKGGRPCIYEKSDVAKRILDKSEWWRIVSLDFTDPKNIVDWTHEREWRIKDNFEFRIEDAYVILPSINQYRTFVSQVDENILKKLKGITVLQMVL